FVGEARHGLAVERRFARFVERRASRHPAADEFAVGVAERLGLARRRHLAGFDACDRQALVRLPYDNRRPTIAAAQHQELASQIESACLLICSVAGITMLLEDRLDIPLETWCCFRLLSNHQRSTGKASQSNQYRERAASRREARHAEVPAVGFMEASSLAIPTGEVCSAVYVSSPRL